jgi:hypothetical protein
MEEYLIEGWGRGVRQGYLIEGYLVVPQDG